MVVFWRHSLVWFDLIRFGLVGFSFNASPEHGTGIMQQCQLSISGNDLWFQTWFDMMSHDMVCVLVRT